MRKKNLLILLLQAVVLNAGFLFSCDTTDTKNGSNYENDVEILSSDNFEGRAPATAGGEKAKAYIENRFEEIGLIPANGNSYRQAVPLLETESYNFSPLRI